MRSLRTRFIIAYAGLITLGFGMIAILAGQQLANTAREDYERQFQNEVMLVGRGIELPIIRYWDEEYSLADLEEAVETYEAQTDCQIQLLLLDKPVKQGRDNNPPEERSPENEEYHEAVPIKPEWEIYPEIVAASRQEEVLIQRSDEDGTPSIYVATPIVSRMGALGYVQMWEPASRLNNAIYSRWLALAIGVGFVTLIAILVSIWLSISLIKPLGLLRDSAIALSQGNLNHRAPDFQADELDQVGKAFNHMAHQVQAMLEEQRAFASNTSHELRTPLTAMRLRTEALRHDSTLDEEMRTQYVEELDDELVRMSRLIEDLILLSRFDSGRAEAGMAQIDFLNFAENLVWQFQTMISDREIILHPPPQPLANIPVQANLNHLNVVFRNVLDNAIKYTPPGGQINWHIHGDGEWLVSTIQDNGQGITTEQLPHIFDRFYRGDKAHSRTIPGSGLGLSLVQAIVEIYDGKITVTSEGVGQGTTVTILWKIQSA